MQCMYKIRLYNSYSVQYTVTYNMCITAFHLEHTVSSDHIQVKKFNSICACTYYTLSLLAMNHNICGSHVFKKCSFLHWMLWYIYQEWFNLKFPLVSGVVDIYSTFKLIVITFACSLYSAGLVYSMYRYIIFLNISQGYMCQAGKSEAISVIKLKTKIYNIDYRAPQHME